MNQRRHPVVHHQITSSGRIGNRDRDALQAFVLAGNDGEPAIGNVSQQGLLALHLGNDAESVTGVDLEHLGKVDPSVTGISTQAEGIEEGRRLEGLIEDHGTQLGPRDGWDRALGRMCRANRASMMGKV